MASRQISFFDQGQQAPHRWHGGRKSVNAVRQPLANAPVTMPPIPASSKSKSKLEAFHFHERTAESDTIKKLDLQNREADKENRPILENSKNTDALQLMPCSQSLSQRSSQKECPQTPVGRLPLAELIAGTNDIAHQNLNLTPVERVLWNLSPSTSQLSSSQEELMSRRGQKRARSSSPTALSETKKPKRFTLGKQPMDSFKPQKALKTPQADPASDLWSRYSHANADNEKASPTRLREEIFVELMKSSSPQTPPSHLQTKELGRLRRSISCTNDWPESVAKKRRLNHTTQHKLAAAGTNASETEHLCQSTTNISRVSVLVERMQDELSGSFKRQRRPSRPAESSPSPEKKADFQTSSQAPSNQAEDAVAFGSRPTDVRGNEGTLNSPNHKSEKSAGTSDFGDDEFNDEMLDIINASLLSACSTTSESGQRCQKEVTETHDAILVDNVLADYPKNCTPSSSTSNWGELCSPSRRSGESSLEPNHTCPRNQLNLIAQQTDQNEFSDDEIEVPSADLEHLASLYDQQPCGETTEDPDDGIVTGPVNPQYPLEEANFTVKTLENTIREDTVIEVVDISSEEEFGEEPDFEDFLDGCAEATQANSQCLSRKRPYTIPRYLIVSVAEEDYETPQGQRRPEKVLSVQKDGTSVRKLILLRGYWFNSHCSPGSFLHLIGEFDKKGQCIVDNSNSLIILHPDHLVSATVVGDSFSCIRRAVLQDRVKVTGASSESQIYGHVLHEIFQEAMKANKWDDDWLHKTIELVASNYLESFFEINLDPVIAVKQLKIKAASLQSWAKTFVAPKPNSNSTIRDRHGGQVTFCVNKLLDVEEKVWSPMYGLKGNVDATVQVSMDDGEGRDTLTVPFELKTGKHTNMAHNAQTAMYTLLLSDRYDIEVTCGILYYMESSEISKIPAVRHELVHMMMQRNAIASYIRHRLELPPMLNSPHLCGKCYAQTACFIYHSLAESGSGETSGMKEKFDDIVQHLKLAHQQFFIKWDNLLTKEEKDIVKVRRELWTMESAEREKVGRCFSNVIIEPRFTLRIEDAPKINRYRYTFMKQKPPPSFSFTDSQITVGEPIVISDEKGHFALASGFVVGIQKGKVEVAVDRQLNNARARRRDFHSQRNQSFLGIMEVVEEGASPQILTTAQSEEAVLYRIDKDEFSNGMATLRNNLIRLMEKDVFGSLALRKLIVESIPPTFRQGPSADYLHGSSSQESLNIDQWNAIHKVLTAKDYALVLGMPGTGKTTTIAHIIRALTAKGKSVLLTSYTHSAVDNILLKIRHDNIGVFRLGALAKVHPQVQEFADLAGVPKKNMDEIERAYSRQVVATTCLGINHPIFNQKVFDYCIVDEASQITLPACLGPIQMARSFILVGDHYQLPPLVQNKEAQEGGLDMSLFKMLSDNQPCSVVNLTHQYRMCEDVMSLSNTLIYNGLLKCGDATVANRTLNIPDMEALKVHHHTPQTLMATPLNIKSMCLNPARGSCWIRDVLDPSTKACFINTDPLLPASRESETGSRIVNACEVTLCTQLVESLLTCGVSAMDIGVITLYRSQLALLKQNLRHRASIEMHTADRFQGRDKEVVILSLVRSNKALNVGDLLKDWRRVNVALTRARTKLLVIGSKSTMRGNELLDRFTNLMDEKGWIYNLTAGVLEGHLFDDGATQLTAGAGTAERLLNDVRARKSIRAQGIEGYLHKGEDKENKTPTKVGRVTSKALLGSRPILRDIVNDES